MDQWKKLAGVLIRELPGKVIRGRWRIGKQLDKGGMGVVFLCGDLAATNSDDHVVKFIQQDQLQEALDALQLKHEYLIPTVAAGVYEFHPQDEQQSERLLFIVMPKAQASLRELMDVQEAGAGDVPWIVADICRGLEYLHSWPGSPLVHRDLKQENVLLTEHYCLADWGIMRSGSYGDTVYATAIATKEYAPPEYYDQLRGAQVPVKPSWDVYSLGIIALELLTGDLWTKKHLDLPEDYPKLSKYIQEIQYICTGCLRREPEARISVSEILALAEASKYKVFKEEGLNEASSITFAWADDDPQGQYFEIPTIEITRVAYHLYALFSGQKSPRPKNDAMQEALHSGSAVYETNSGRLRILEYDKASTAFAMWETGVLDFDIDDYRLDSKTDVGDPIDDLADVSRLVYGTLPLDFIQKDPTLRRLWL